MAFSLNKTANKVVSKLPLWKIEHIVGNSFVTFLLDTPLMSETNKNDKDILTFLEKIIQKSGIYSYVITSSLRFKPAADDLKKAKTEFYVKNDSGWFDEIIKPSREKGIEANVVVPFGASFYQIIKTGTDITVEDLIYPAFENYIYIGHGWIGDYDCFLFPQYSIGEIFLPGEPHGINKVELGAWKMNFMVSVFKKIAKKEYELPDDMTEPQLIEIGESYDENKEKGINEIKDFLNSHFNSDICSFDLETDGLKPFTGRIRCITLSFDSTTGYYIEWKPFNDNKDLLDLLSKMMKSCKERVTVNGKFDIKFLWAHGLDRSVNVTQDAMTLSHVLCSGRKKGLKTQTYYWTPFGGYDNKLDLYRDSLKKKGIKDPSYYDIPKNILKPYATMDAVMTTRVWKAGMRRVHRFDNDYPTEKPIEHTGGHAYTVYEWYNYVMKLYKIICSMEFEGVYLDEHVIELHRKVFMDKLKEIRNKLAEIFNVSPDYEFSSSVQLGKLLEEKGWPCYGKSVYGTYATSDACFIEWSRDKLKGVEELKEFRRINNALQTYLGVKEKTVNQKTGVVKEEWSGWPQYTVHHEDGTDRLHCNFAVCGAETFRMISREPNLQNVPTRSQEGAITKMSFTVPPAPMYFITDDKGKEWKATSLALVNTERGYVIATDLKEDDTIVDIGKDTILEYDEWHAKGIKAPLGIETAIA